MNQQHSGTGSFNRLKGDNLWEEAEAGNTGSCQRILLSESVVSIPLQIL